MITQRTAVPGVAARPPAPRRQARRTSRALRRSARLTLALLVILAFVSPIYLTIVNAFKTNAAIASSPQSLPVHPTLRNVSAALSQPGHVLELGLRNSLIVVVCSALNPPCTDDGYFAPRTANRLPALSWPEIAVEPVSTLPPLHGAA